MSTSTGIGGIEGGPPAPPPGPPAGPDGAAAAVPLISGADTLGTLQHITSHGYPYTWFLLNRAIIKKEFALSGSEQNPDLTGKSIRMTLGRIGKAVQPPVQAFMDQGADFVVRRCRIATRRRATRRARTRSSPLFATRDGF